MLQIKKTAQWKKVAELTPGMLIAVPKEEAMNQFANNRHSGLSRIDSGVADAPQNDEYSDVLWDEIVSIKRLSPERVYDIEVEGTHNFVANGIFAHNTYLHLDPTGNVIMDNATGLAYNGQLEEIRNSKFEIRNSAGELVQRATAFSEAAIANLRAGLVTAQKLVADTATLNTVQTGLISPLPNSDLVINLANDSGKVGSLSGDSFGRLLVQGQNGQTVASIDSQGNVHAEGDLSARSASFSGTLRAQNVILGTQSEAWRTPGSILDSGQNDGTTGQARMTVNGDASISGTLRANRIEANDIVGLKATFADLLAASISATHITNVTDITRITEVTRMIDQIASSSSTPRNDNLGQLTATPSSVIASGSEAISTPSALLASMFPGLASYSAMLADSLAQPSTSRLSLDSLWDITKINQPLTFEQAALFNDTLSVFGTTSLGQTLVTGPLTQDGTLVFDNGNEINAIGQTLYIQKLAEGGVDFLNGKVTIAQNGDMRIEGNLMVKGTAGFGQLLVKGVNGEVVASVNASGSATFQNVILGSETTPGSTDSGQVLRPRAQDRGARMTVNGDASISGQILAQAATFGRLTIDTGLSIPEAQAQATSSTEITANGTIGRAAISTGYTYLIIHNSQLTAPSMIYLTPTSRTAGIAPYVSEVTAPSAYTPGVEPGLNPENTPGVNVLPDRYFRVEIDRPLPQDLTFNWLIVN